MTNGCSCRTGGTAGALAEVASWSGISLLAVIVISSASVAAPGYGGGAFLGTASVILGGCSTGGGGSSSLRACPSATSRTQFITGGYTTA